MLGLTFGGVHSVGLDKCKMCIHHYIIIYGIFSLFFKIQSQWPSEFLGLGGGGGEGKEAALLGKEHEMCLHI